MKAKFVLQTILILTVYAGLFDVVDVEGEWVYKVIFNNVSIT
jgi:hypothetical protein